ncbi:MAG: type II toxin-antitoxin system MqsA family antitoxin [Acidobacteria bacterium]|nr:type II toxin-antitoxin system MqsA family antitoxin [Acidobacteriota bacterium]
MQRRIKCAECGGTLAQRTITHTQAWGDQLYRFDQVPALVCTQCGQVWLPAEVSQLVDEIIQAPPKPKKFYRVPVFSFSELTKAS